jgi:general secretion pathway protein N
MIPCGRIVAIAMMACGLTGVISTLGRAANDSADLDLRMNVVDKPIAPSSGGGTVAPTEPSIGGNPLWAIPLSLLKATRERPIFLPSRRPPAPVITATRVEPVITVPPEPEQPGLSLVGVVTGTSDGFAIFIDKTANEVVRLKTGEGHNGWILRSVSGREAVLEKNSRTAVIGLPTGDQK